VARVGLRTVTGPAPGGQPQPRAAALARPDRVDPQPRPAVEREPARLADALGAALEQLTVALGEKPRPVLGAGLLVGGERHHHVAPGPHAGPGPGPDRREDHR